MATSSRVLVVYGSESGTCKRLANSMAKHWRALPDSSFSIVHVCDGEGCLKEMSIMEDDNNVIQADFTSLKAKYDVLVVITSSYGEGDPPETFGGFFLQLLAAVESGNRPLVGMQHCVLGQGSTVYQETFQNVPRLTDKYLGEAGSRRLLMRQELDAAHYNDDARAAEERSHWREAVASTLNALPAASAPSVCEWDAARKSHVYPTGKVTLKSKEDLAEFKLGAASGATNEVVFGLLFWGIPMAVVVACGFYYAQV